MGGYVKEYQIDIDPDKMRAFNISLGEVVDAVRKSNIDIGAKTIEVNRVEYFVRSLGFLKNLEDVENIVIKEFDNTPVFLKNFANVSFGPASRRGALDKEGAQVVGGVVVVRHGENPLAVINRVKQKIEQITPGLPSKELADGTISKVKVVPFYDRTKLINETLGTLEDAISNEILITVIVVIILLVNLRSSILVSGLLPLAVLMSFIAMKLGRIDSNIMSLSGIAIAIGTIVDMGIIMSENIVRHFDNAEPGEKKFDIIYNAASEVGSAVLTAISTTVIAFLPVFVMTGPEGKLFKPLAFTKTFALIASVLTALFILPTFAYYFFGKKKFRIKEKWNKFANIFIVFAGIAAFIFISWWIGIIILFFGIYRFLQSILTDRAQNLLKNSVNYTAALFVVIFLSDHWMPLGVDKSFTANLFFVILLIGIVLGFFKLFLKYYETILRYFLAHKVIFYSLPAAVLIFGLVIWKGFDWTFAPVEKAFRTAGFSEKAVKGNRLWVSLSHTFPGLGKEFMPSLDEGSFLLMPTTMPHASFEEALDVLQKQDIAIKNIPEIETVVGKIGRVESALDPAPVSMVETVINYKPEYGPADPETGKRTRQWRDHIKSPDDIWKEIVRVSKIVGTTSAPKLQPIETRIVMLQSGMRAPMGVKVYGPSLEIVEQVGLEIEKFLKEVPSIEPATVIADRIIGKPYLEIEPDRELIARYGVNIRDVQDVIEYAVGGTKITTAIEGRERFPVRIRYQRELRDNLEALSKITVPVSSKKPG